MGRKVKGRAPSCISSFLANCHPSVRAPPGLDSAVFASIRNVATMDRSGSGNRFISSIRLGHPRSRRTVFTSPANEGEAQTSYERSILLDKAPNVHGRIRVLFRPCRRGSQRGGCTGNADRACSSLCASHKGRGYANRTVWRRIPCLHAAHWALHTPPSKMKSNSHFACFARNLAPVQSFP